MNWHSFLSYRKNFCGIYFLTENKSYERRRFAVSICVYDSLPDEAVEIRENVFVKEQGFEK